MYTGQINEKKRKKVAAKTTPEVREDINGKKTFSFGHCPNHLNPPPPDPNSGNLVLFFGRQKRRFARMTKKNFNDDNDGCNDNYDDNYGNFDDDYDKNDSKTCNYCEV